MKAKRILSLLLTFCMVFALAQFPVAAATGTYNSFKYSMENSEVTITGYTGTETAVTVPATINGFPVIAIGDSAFALCSNITSIKLPSGIKKIGNYAFRGCSGLISLSVPDGVTSLGSYAFTNCSSLASITIPNSVTSIGAEAFSGCSSLATITLPNNIVAIYSRTFKNCTSLSSITFAAKVKLIDSSAFSDCSALTDVYFKASEVQRNEMEIADGNTYVTDATWHYIGCDPDNHKKYDEAKLSFTYSGYPFEFADGAYHSTNKTNSSTSTFIITAKTAGGMKLEYLTSSESGCDLFIVTHNDTERVTASGIGTTWKTLNFTLEPGDRVTLTYQKDRSGAKGDDAVYFKIFPLVSEVFAQDVNATCGEGVICDICGAEVKPATGNHTYTNNCDTDCNVCGEERTAPHVYDNNCDKACNSCGSTRTVGSHVYDNGCDPDCNECGEVTRITEHVFDDDNDLICNECGFEREAAIAPVRDFNYNVVDSKVVIIGYMGSDTEVVIPSIIDGYPVTEIAGDAFSLCLNIKSITVPDSVTTIGDYAFNWCISLESIDLGNGVKTIGNAAFMGCTALKEITIPATVTNFGYSPFYGCTALESINVKEGNTKFVSIDGVLYGLSGGGVVYKLIKVPANKQITTFEILDSLWSVESDAFDDNKHIQSIVASENCFDYFTIDGVLFGKNNGTLIRYPVGKTDTEYTIPDGVQEIYISAFGGCTELESVIIPDSVTTIWGSAFYGCSSLKEVTLGEGVTYIYDSAFYGCSSIIDVYYNGTEIQRSEITIEDYNDGLTDATWHYADEIVCEHSYDNDCDEECNNCGEIRETTHIYTDDCDADCNECNATRKAPHTYDNNRDAVCNECGYERKLGNPASDFEYYVSNDEVTITDYIGTETDVIVPEVIEDCPVTTIGMGAFSRTAVTSVVFPDSVKTVKESVFDSCLSLKEVDLGDGIQKIGLNLFKNCVSLETITIPASATNVDPSAFEGCSALTEINVEQGNAEYVSINGVLYSLYDGEVNNLEKYPAGKKETSFEIPSYIWGVDTNAFNDNKYLQAITVEEGNIFLRAQDGVLFDAFSNNLIRYPEGKPGTTYAIPDDTTAIYFSAFEGCDKLVSVTIPESVTKIWSNAFRNCTSLESIAIPEGVQQISGSAFNGCLALSSVTIPKSVTQITSFAFDGCSALTDVYYDGTEEDKASIIIGSYNTPLTNATWHYKPESDFEYTVEDGEAVITGYNGTASELIIPDEIDSYPVVGIADYAFYNNTTLTAVYFPNTLRYIGEYAFYGCTSLLGDLGQTIWSVRSEVSTILTIPDSVTYIGAYAFGGCDSLKEVALGSSVESIGDGAFSDCTALETINIPTSVTTIGNGVFTGCDSLVEVRYEGSADDKENITFGDGNDNLFDIWQDTVDRLPGDVNGDGFVNNKDFGILRQYLNKWSVTINESNADVTGDGVVNNKDMGLLRQYLNNWDVVLK